MRVTFQSTFRNGLFDVNQAAERYADKSQQVSSGKRMQSAADDPSAFSGGIRERTEMATLDTFIAELHRFVEGVTADELNRAKIGLKASIIMSGESTSARAGAIAHDFFMRGRIRTLEEIKAAIDAVTVEAVNDYVKKHEAGPFTIVTVGPNELKRP